MRGLFRNSPKNPAAAADYLRTLVGFLGGCEDHFGLNNNSRWKVWGNQLAGGKVNQLSQASEHIRGLLFF